MSLITLVKSACRRIGVPPPNVVATATDATVMQLLELANEEGTELARYGDWKALRKEKTFTTVAQEEQTNGTLPTDWAGFIDDTLWNRARRWKLYGPVSSEEWQRWKATSTFPVTNTFYLRGTSWLMQPVTPAGDTIAYEYRSANWCQSSGGTAQSAWASDTDTGLLSERLMALGLIWRYRFSRRMEWEPDYDKYIFQVEQELAKDQPRKIIDLKQGGPPTRVPGAVVPDGSWNL
jgi:hypothetical protein